MAKPKVYLLDERDYLLDAFGAVAWFAQDLNDAVRAAGAAHRVHGDPRAGRLRNQQRNGEKAINRMKTHRRQVRFSDFVKDFRSKNSPRAAPSL